MSLRITTEIESRDVEMPRGSDTVLLRAVRATLHSREEAGISWGVGCVGAAVMLSGAPRHYTSLMCWPDVEELLRTQPVPHDRRGADRWYIPCAYVTGALIYKSYQLQGLGTRAYLDLVAASYLEVGPFLFMPDACAAGDTSLGATRVWQSLYRRFPHHGRVIAVVETPSGSERRPR